MKDVREQFQVEGNVTGTSVAMGIDLSSMAHIMNVLTDLYSNKKRAVIREYSTNAFDAHTESGQTRPIEVTLPSTLSPFLRIKDLGVGLTADDIQVIYSQYGASTKRGSNEQNGMLGLGCKSALTYCSQFTVTSVKDGQKIIVNVGRDESGGGQMTVVSALPSDEPSGTEVTIPVGRYDIDAIGEEARDFYRFWKPGTVLVNGKEPAQFEGLRLADNLFVLEGESESLIVMGNVAYPAPQLDSLVPSASVVAFVPIGAVNFPPSREALMDTKTTRTTIESIKAQFKRDVQGAVQREVDTAPTPQDAIRVVVKWSKYLSGGAKASDFTYKSAKIPTVLRMPAYSPAKDAWQQQPAEATMLRSGVNSYKMGDARKELSIGVHEWPSTLWIENYVPEKFTAGHKRKLLKWCELNHVDTGNFGVRQFVMVRGKMPANEFIATDRVVSWEDIRKVKLEVAHRGYGPPRIPGSYDVWTETGYEPGVPGDKLRQHHPLFYFQGNRFEASGFDDAVKVYYGAYTIVCLPLNRVDKFKRILPAAKEVKAAIMEKFDEWAKTVTVDQRKSLAMDEDERKALALIDAGKIFDPALQDAVRISKIDVSAIEAARRTFQRYVSTIALYVEWAGAFTDYPLIDLEFYRLRAVRLLRDDPEHVYTYLNAAYAARQTGGN